MTLRRKRIVLMPNTEKNIDPQWMNSLVFHLHASGCDLRAPESSRRMFFQAEACIAFFEDKDPLYEKADLILVFGGDGSIIRAARSSVGREIPIAGINCGRLGYLAEIESNETDLLDAIVTGEGIIERRIMLDVQILREDTILGVDTPALNDIVLTNETAFLRIVLQRGTGGELLRRRYDSGGAYRLHRLFHVGGRPDSGSVPQLHLRHAHLPPDHEQSPRYIQRGFHFGIPEHKQPRKYRFSGHRRTGEHYAAPHGYRADFPLPLPYQSDPHQTRRIPQRTTKKIVINPCVVTQAGGHNESKAS